MSASATENSRSIERAFSILQFLLTTRRRWGISELSRKLGLPKSSTHVIVITLERLGYVRRETGKGQFGPGLRIFAIGNGIDAYVRVADLALPHMRQLTDRSCCTSHLAVRENYQAIYIQKAQALGSTEFDTYVGKHIGLHCTAVGKILLAFTGEDSIKTLLSRRSLTRHTPNTICSGLLLREKLEQIRIQGYALDNQEEELGTWCLAVPVLLPGYHSVAALGLSGNLNQFRKSELNALVCKLRSSAEAIVGSITLVNSFFHDACGKANEFPLDVQPGIKPVAVDYKTVIFT
jgi:DNA-binding IclR family transcriptional regulator